MKYTGPKVRLSRALGIALTPKSAKVMEKKSAPPGQHGPNKSKMRSRTSDYKRQLVEKQRLRAQYNIHERQMRNYYRKAVKMPGNTEDTIIQLLESRLDALVYRGGLATTIYAARQYVNHGHITVNGQRVNIPSYRVKPGDVIAVKQKSQSMDCFAVALESANPPRYISLDPAAFSIRYTDLPVRSEVPVICEMVQVIEYYARRK